MCVWGGGYCRRHTLLAFDKVNNCSDLVQHVVKYLLYFLPGVVQGMVTGIRGLCNGLGPALYGFIFFLFHVELSELGTIETTQDPIKKVCDRTHTHISFMNLFTQVTFQKYLVLITKVWKSRDSVRSGPLFCGWTVCVDLRHT